MPAFVSKHVEGRVAIDNRQQQLNIQQDQLDQSLLSQPSLDTTKASNSNPNAGFIGTSHAGHSILKAKCSQDAYKWTCFIYKHSTNIQQEQLDLFTNACSTDQATCGCLAARQLLPPVLHDLGGELTAQLHTQLCIVGPEATRSRSEALQQQTLPHQHVQNFFQTGSKSSAMQSNAALFL